MIFIFRLIVNATFIFKNMITIFSSKYSVTIYIVTVRCVHEIMYSYQMIGV